MMLGHVRTLRASAVDRSSRAVLETHLGRGGSAARSARHPVRRARPLPILCGGGGVAWDGDGRGFRRSGDARAGIRRGFATKWTSWKSTSVDKSSGDSRSGMRSSSACRGSTSRTRGCIALRARSFIRPRPRRGDRDHLKHGLHRLRRGDRRSRARASGDVCQRRHRSARSDGRDGILRLGASRVGNALRFERRGLYRRSLQHGTGGEGLGRLAGAYRGHVPTSPAN